MSNKLIPRGLRVQVFPSFGLDDNPFNQKWEDICKNCAFAFMSLIIEHNTLTLNEISKQIEDLDIQLLKLPTVEIEAFKNEMSTAMRDGRNRQQLKQKKFKGTLMILPTTVFTNGKHLI